MGLRELNIDLTKEHVALWDLAKKFMREVWRPAAVELEEPDPDAKPEPGEPTAPAGVEEPVALVDVEAENRILPRAERPEEG